ncbi:hypothetical protein H7Y29_02260 [Microbacteriaceae bacterium]|nr:hypothetical protein [Candidatus Saccharibacteria bacterium]
MNRGELLAHADEQSLTPLLELSDHLILQNGRISGINRIEVPLDEHGIPKRTEFVKMALGTIAADHYWSGFLDVHHLAWPGANYRDLNYADDRYMALKYRGCATLKVRVPRQLHNYFHKISFEPPVPSADIMHQWLLEQNQVDRLFDTICISSLSQFDINHDAKEEWRKSSYIAKLEQMRDGELGLMPDREMLSRLELHHARQALRGIARVRGITNDRRSHRSFFKEAA